MIRNRFTKNFIHLILLIVLFSFLFVNKSFSYCDFNNEEFQLDNSYYCEKSNYYEDILQPTSINVLQDDFSSDLIISLNPNSMPIYDETMMNFHNIFDCHNVAQGEGVNILIIDTPVDYRHEIFNQENYCSLTQDSCYFIDCDYSTGDISNPQPAPTYTNNFSDYFDLTTNYLWPSEIYHGTFILD